MLGQETEKLPDVALIGVERLARHAPLAAEMAQPARDLGRDVARGVRQLQCFVGLWHRRACLTAAV
jgi:hypothetical protein